ncbi:hypothetical protein [Pseudomonas sp. 4810-S13]|uniref:hypothetical protein n=1 Tax=Pseudomonas sp. 4810-S13 TaxID=3120822 RepID=UPI0031B68722
MLARIRIQKVPSVSPVGSGAEYDRLADDRCCLAEATAVIRHHDQVEHKAGMKFRRREGSEL